LLSLNHLDCFVSYFMALVERVHPITKQLVPVFHLPKPGSNLGSNRFTLLVYQMDLPKCYDSCEPAPLQNIKALRHLCPLNHVDILQSSPTIEDL
jgi:hypothetical protein